MATWLKDSRPRNTLLVPKAAVAITKGDILKKNGTSNNVTNNVASGDTPFGIAESTQVAGDSTVKVTMLKPGDICIADAQNNSVPAAGDFKSCDLFNTASVASGVDLAANINHDVLYMYNGTTNTVDVFFQKLQIVNAN